MNITEADENYLETILVISKTNTEIHAADICAHLGFSRPTVSERVKQMKERGLIEVDGENHLWLTQTGLKIAERIYDRHNTIAQFFIKLGVDEKTAYEDACKMEHDISDVSFACLKRHLDKI